MTVERSKRRCLFGRFYKYIKEMRSVFSHSANHMVVSGVAVAHEDIRDLHI